MKLVGVFLGGLVVAALIAIAVLYFADLELVSESGGEPDSELISVPHLLGQQTYDAEAEILDAGLVADVNRLRTEAWYGTPVRDATVRTQNPDPGSEVEPQTAVTISVK